MSAIDKSALENACLDCGWFAYISDVGARVTVALPPTDDAGRERTMQALLRGAYPLGAMQFTSEQRATVWIRLHPRIGSPAYNANVTCVPATSKR